MVKVICDQFRSCDLLTHDSPLLEMTQARPTGCVFLEKYNVAPAPSRDYYGIRIAGNSLTLFVWKISRIHSTFPVVISESLSDFILNTSLQYEIGRLFGEELLGRALAISRGEKTYLPHHLPATVLLRILADLDLRDIPSVARACRKLDEVTKSNGLWEKLALKYFIGTIPPEQRKRARNIGWKKFFRANLHKTWIKSRPVITQPNQFSPSINTNSASPRIKANPSPSIKANSPSPTIKVVARPAKSSLEGNVINVKPGRQDISPRLDKISDNELTKTDKSESYQNLTDTRVNISRSIIQPVKSETNHPERGNSRKNQTNAVGNNIQLDCKTLAIEIRRTVDEIRLTKSVKTPLETISKLGTIQVKSDKKPETSSKTETYKTGRTVMRHRTICGMTDKTLNKSDRALTNLTKISSEVRNSVINPTIIQRTQNNCVSEPSNTNSALNKMSEIKLPKNLNKVAKPATYMTKKTFSATCREESRSSRPNTVNKVSTSASVINPTTQSNCIRTKYERNSILNESTVGKMPAKSERNLTKPGGVLNKTDKKQISSDSKVKKP